MIPFLLVMVKSHMPENRKANLKYCLKIGQGLYLSYPYYLLSLSSLGIWHSVVIWSSNHLWIFKKRCGLIVSGISVVLLLLFRAVTILGTPLTCSFDAVYVMRC